ncbi:MAG: AbrB/MazE/SpoVT family DNA-binding domain-containing protein [Bacteroidota bacterium]
MTATVDKFGRVVIPKKIRDSIGIGPGSEIDFTPDPVSVSVSFKPVRRVEPIITVDEFGWPSIHFPGQEIMTFDIKEMIKEGYEERYRKTTGNYGELL